MNMLQKQIEVDKTQKLNFEEIGNLFKEKLALIAQTDGSAIDLNQSLSDYLVDSLKIIRFAASICDELEIDFEPILTGDFDNMLAIVHKLHAMSSAKNDPRLP